MPRCDFIDWFKAIGISLIVYGHVATATTLPWTPPIYIKQLGVAFFIFATGFTLAREQRPMFEALVTRLFPVYVFGLTVAGLMTAVGLVSSAGGSPGSGLALSNYLPFLGGANVIFDNFPANPTTWYLGTYLHILIVWAVWLRRVRISSSLVVIALVLEIGIRAVLMAWAGPYIAYMLLTNWMTVFLLGLMCGGRPATAPRGSAVPYVIALLGGMTVWALALRPLRLVSTFPFMTLEGWPTTSGLLLVSVAASTLYVCSTLLAFSATRRITAPRSVQFIARNSLIVFLAHMPVVFAIDPYLQALGLAYWPKVLIRLFLCSCVLAIVSEIILKTVEPKRLGNRLLYRFTDGRHLANGAKATVQV